MQLSEKSFREATIGKAREIHDRAIKEGRDLTATEQASFNSLLDTFKAATGTTVPRDKEGFDRYCSAPMGEISSVQLAASAIQGCGDGVTLYDETGRAVRGLGKGESFASAICDRAKVTRKSCGEAFACDGLTLGGYLRAMVTGPRTKVEMAALNTGSGGSGGYTVPEYLSAQLIDKFRAQTVLTKLGALTIPMDSQTHTFTRLLADPVPQWRQELTEIGESEPTFGAITMSARSLAVICRVSRELLQDSLNIEAAIERSLAGAFALEVDRVGLFGMGAAGEPMGLYNEEGTSEVTSVGTPAGYGKVLDGYKKLLDSNAPEPTGLIYSPREWRTFAGMTSATELQPLMRPPAIADLPFEVTSAIPTNLGGGSESAMFLGHFPDFAFGMRADMQIEVLKELFAGTHEYGFVAHLRMDTGVFHPGSFCKLTGVTSA